MWHRTSSFNASVAELTLNWTELSIIGEASQSFKFTGNNNSVQDYSYTKLRRWRKSSIASI